MARCESYRKRQARELPLVKLKYKQYPRLVEAVKNRHQGYNETLDYIAKKEKRGELFVLRPKRELPLKNKM